jgi:hypothetical protein
MVTANQIKFVEGLANETNMLNLEVFCGHPRKKLDKENRVGYYAIRQRISDYLLIRCG